MSPRIGARRRNVVLGLGVLVLGTLGGTFAVFESAALADSVNLSCPQGATEYKVDGDPLSGLSNGQSASFTVDGQTFTFTKVIGPSPFEDDTFDFTSTVAVSVVYVKGGVDTNQYDYAPPTTSGSGLHPPPNSGGQAPAISHVAFCVGASTTTTTSTTTSTTVPETTTTTVPETTTTTVPETTTTITDQGTTTTTVPETTTTTVPETTTTTVPETTTTITDQGTTTTTTVPETTTTTVPETTTTLGEQGSTTTTTVPEETTTTVPEETTTTFSEQGSTTIFTTTTTDPQSTTTLAGQGGTIPTTTSPPVTITGTLPRTGSGVAFPALFALSCVAAGVLLVASRRRSWSRP